VQPLVKMYGINKSFAGAVALRNAALSVSAGEVHGVIGQNGAGKSTLIKILTGVYRKDDGQVHFDEKNINITSPREAQSIGIATIYQELNLVALRSVTENIVMGYEPKTYGGLIDWNRAHLIAEKLMTRFGVEIDVRAPLGNYSTAIQQLVAIARAVSLNAKLVIMDEATSSLDANEVETLFGVVKSLKKTGVSVLYITHFLDELFSVADRVTVMRDGQTVGERNISETSKIELIADMLGRNVKEIEAAGMTDFKSGETEAGEELLEVKKVTTGNRLSNLNIKIHHGEIVGLGGLLGSGRTEAARAIFGVDPILKGGITFKGLPFKPKGPKHSIAQGIALLTEDRKLEGIIPEMSVRENLTLALLPKLTKGLQINHIKERKIVERFIASLDIKTTDMDQPIRELSGGNQQKVLLARWLAVKPKLLILDEPTRGVDVGAKLEIQAIIRKFVDEGGGVILISSEFEELVEGADRIVVMHDGYSGSELVNPGVTEDTLINAIAISNNKVASG